MKLFLHGSPKEAVVKSDVEKIQVVRPSGSRFVIDIRVDGMWFRIFDETSGKINRIEFTDDEVDLYAKTFQYKPINKLY